MSRFFFNSRFEEAASTIGFKENRRTHEEDQDGESLFAGGDGTAGGIANFL